MSINSSIFPFIALGLKRSVLPHPSTYRRVLNSGLDSAQLEAIVGAFLEGCRQHSGQVGPDGKIMHGTVTDEQRGVYLLAVYEPRRGLS